VDPVRSTSALGAATDAFTDEMDDLPSGS